MEGTVDENEEEEQERPDPTLKKPDLYMAAKENNTEYVLSLLDEDVPPTFIDKTNGWTALHWACKAGNVTMVKCLLEKGVSEPYHRMVRAKKAAKLRHQKKSRRNEAEAAPLAPEEDVNTAEAERAMEEKIAEEDADNDMEETSTDLTKNTPLLWAVYKGHLNVLWLLLVDGYSPNDMDEMKNNALHMAASGGFLKILQVLVDDGGDIASLNLYKNTPLDVATDRGIRDFLVSVIEAREKEAKFSKGAVSSIEEDVARKHEQNIQKYTKMLNNLTNALTDAMKSESPRIIANNAGMGAASDMVPIRALAGAIAETNEWALNEDLVHQGEKLLAKLECTHDLRGDIATLQQNIPITKQADYITFVQPVERTLMRAESVGADKPLQQLAHDVISRCQIEYWICVLMERLKDVTCAIDSDEHDMTKLKMAIQKGQALRASENILDDAIVFHLRLESELAMSRAIASVPTVRLPMTNVAPEDVPPNYWQECDVGHIQETDEYPNAPPAIAASDGVAASPGGYIWIHSSSYSALVASMDALKASLHSTDSCGANVSVVADAKTKLTQAEKEYKILHMKDATDKQTAIEVATKAAKKLKKKKK